VKPKTGRTHQIRVHFKAINHPVVADKLYAPKLEAELGFKRLALHAKAIEFRGLHGKVIKANAPYPADFEKALKTLK
jgi:23S rRNA pseudouridine1911/1915/1917 synthase